ncbi:hypothetical protein E8E12_000881 [Didymella heteroderae]|uniref:Uncharacterized protein n=1 Tax=Didymella heteroderae TaxID=1769908 RepID=A0A9P4WFJ5_9PLEO|nr:hypothetical protein E8E12_000881 [Didymella heteroderae]
MSSAIDKALREIEKVRELVKHDIHLFKALLDREYKKRYRSFDILSTYAEELLKRRWLLEALERMRTHVQALKTNYPDALKRLQLRECREVMRISRSNFLNLEKIVWPPLEGKKRRRWLAIKELEHSEPSDNYTDWHPNYEGHRYYVTNEYSEDAVFDYLAKNYPEPESEDL